MIVGYYIKPNRKKPNKGVIYNQKGISPCLTDYSGGGNLVPTIIVKPSTFCPRHDAHTENGDCQHDTHQH